MKRKAPRIELTIEERKQLLAKPTWNYKDVMKYTGFAKSKAMEIMRVCKEKLNGKVLFNEHLVKRDSVLAYNSSSIEREKYVLKELDKET